VLRCVHGGPDAERRVLVRGGELLCGDSSGVTDHIWTIEETVALLD
jgi:hypothetical protein